MGNVFFFLFRSNELHDLTRATGNCDSYTNVSFRRDVKGNVHLKQERNREARCRYWGVLYEERELKRKQDQ